MPEKWSRQVMLLVEQKEIGSVTNFYDDLKDALNLVTSKYDFEVIEGTHISGEEILHFQEK